jgi:hypothetical protein
LVLGAKHLLQGRVEHGCNLGRPEEARKQQSKPTLREREHRHQHEDEEHERP